MPSRLVFRPAAASDAPMLRDLAERIWRTSYAALLTPAQIDYMLGWMYAPDAIAAEIQRGVTWVIASLEAEPAGFLSLSATTDDVAELHKLYLLPALQGGGHGQTMLRHAQGLASAAGAAALRLRVNKGNTRALRAYARAGFRIADEVVVDIGGGFVMDDFVLTRPLGAVPLVKICGLSTPETLETAIVAGADQIGLVFFPRSPRHVTFDQARGLADQARRRAEIVALTVDASDAELDALMEAVRPDWLQLHGREQPERVAAVRTRTGRPIMKAVGIAAAADLAAARRYHAAADMLLFDAKPQPDAMLPGGNGIPFDWTLLRESERSFTLSGGLTPHNVAEAIRIASPAAVDVSSGVENAPGRKDPALIEAFVANAKRM